MYHLRVGRYTHNNCLSILASKINLNKIYSMELIMYLPPTDFGNCKDLVKGEGPTPVDHTSNPYGTSVPSSRIIF